MRPGTKPLDVHAVKLLPGMKNDWLQKDADMIWRVRNMLPAKDGAAAFFKPFEGVRKTDLGFGYERRIAQIGGGFTSCSITGVSHDDAFVDLHASCSSSANADETRAIAPTLTTAFGPAWTFDPAWSGSWNVDYTFPAAQADARAALDKELGVLTPVDASKLPADIAKAYALLMSVKEEVIVGGHCGAGGVMPEAKTASELLAAAHRDDLLRNVLHGPNPGSRVYAARALTMMDAMTAADLALAKKLADDKTEITTCYGCVITQISSAEAYALEW